MIQLETGQVVLLSLCLTSRQLYAATYLNGLHCHCCHKASDSRDGLSSLVGFTQTLLSRLDLGSRVRRIIIKTARRPRGPYIWSKSYTRNHRNQDEVPSRSKATSACLNNLQIKRQHSIFTQSTKSTTRDIFAVLLRFLQYNLSSCLF